MAPAIFALSMFCLIAYLATLGCKAYLKRKEMQHEKEMRTKIFEHEEKMRIVDSDDSCT